MRSPNNDSKRVVMLLSNPFRPDPRVLKEARTLTEAGYRVYILCWDRQGEYPEHEQIDGIIVRRFNIKSVYSAGSKQMLYLPRFWLRAFKEMSILIPDIVHCHDLDTTIPGYLYALMHRVPWIYDAHECYPEQIRPQVHQIIYRTLVQLEKFISPRASHLITVGRLLANHFQSFGARTSIVGNYPDLISYQTNPHHINQQHLNIPSSELIIAYIGGFTQAREILPLIVSSSLVPDVTVLLAGDGPQRPIIEAAIPHYPKVRYLGWIPQELVPAYTSLADVIYYGLNISDGNSTYSSPNALFNAMAAGKPILTTDVGEVAQIVKERNCGLVITRATPELIASAIVQFKDATLRDHMASNASNAAITAYNWGEARGKLLSIYRQL